MCVFKCYIHLREYNAIGLLLVLVMMRILNTYPQILQKHKQMNKDVITRSYMLSLFDVKTNEECLMVNGLQDIL